MTTRLIFTVPYTGHEVIVATDGDEVIGIAYDPLSTSDPVTWVKGCPLCTEGSKRVPLKVRRAVKCLATLRSPRPGEYAADVVTGTKKTHTVKVTMTADARVATVRKLRSNRTDPLVMTSRGGSTEVSRGKAYDYRGAVVKRALRMLLSAREASEKEIRAVLAGLPGDESVPGRHSPDAEVSTLTSRVQK